MAEGQEKVTFTTPEQRILEHSQNRTGFQTLSSMNQHARAGKPVHVRKDPLSRLEFLRDGHTFATGSMISSEDRSIVASYELRKKH